MSWEQDQEVRLPVACVVLTETLRPLPAPALPLFCDQGWPGGSKAHGWVGLGLQVPVLFLTLTTPITLESCFDSLNFSLLTSKLKTAEAPVPGDVMKHVEILLKYRI